jgi:hypothetical protein
VSLIPVVCAVLSQLIGLGTLWFVLFAEDWGTARAIPDAAEPVDLTELPIVPNHDHQGLVY